jgi:hypothetical protein
LYGWSLALQEDNNGDSDGGVENKNKGCWMTEAVYPLGYGAGFFASM